LSHPPNDSSPLWLLGASGPTGRALMPMLRAGGHAVTAWSRQAREEAGVHWRQLALETSRLPCSAETIVSLGPLDHLSLWLTQVDTPNLRRVIALGSISVRTKAQSSSAEERALALRLLAAEDLMIATAKRLRFELVLVRATMIWNGHDDANVAPLIRLAKRWRVLPIPARAGGKRNPVFAEDLAARINDTINTPMADEPTIVIREIGGAERLDQQEILRRIARAARATPLPMPMFVLRIGTWLLGRRGAGLARTIDRWDQDQLADCPEPAQMRGFDP